MPVLILPLNFLLLFFLFSTRTCPSRDANGRRAFFLSAAVAFGVLLTFITEGLSLFNALAFSQVLMCWGLFSLALAFSFILPQKAKLSFAGHVRAREALLLPGLALIILVTAVTAIFSAPNTTDSMTYHLGRVFHWIQNRNVAFYPTNILRQLSYAPWAEFAVAHAQILSGSDRFANLIQWGAMAGSLIAVSLIAKQLGAGKNGQIFAAVICATIPMGILQASSTQNDYTASFWLLCFIHFLLALKNDWRWPTALGAGASLGIAFLTKATAYLYAFPFLIWLCLSGFKTLKRRAWPFVLLILMTSLLINFGHIARVTSLFGSPLGPPALKETVMNQTMSLPLFASNLIRNTGLHLGTPVPVINSAVYSAVRSMHEAMGVDMNDSRTTFARESFFIPFSFHEDKSGALAHFLLVASASLSFLLARREKNKNLFPYLSALFSVVILFTWILKWQPWNSRLQLPLFAAASPFVAAVMAAGSGDTNRKNGPEKILGAALILIALPFVFFNASRPFFGEKNILKTSRNEQLFFNRTDLKESYFAAADYIKSGGCSDIGIILGESGWEYPLIELLGGKKGPGFRLEHVNIRNVSSGLYQDPAFDRFRPCAILTPIPTHAAAAFHNGAELPRSWSDGTVTIFTPKSPLSES